MFAQEAQRCDDSELSHLLSLAEQDDQPVGTLFVGLVGPGFDEVRQSRLPGQREQMRQFAVITALGFLREHLQER